MILRAIGKAEMPLPVVRPRSITLVSLPAPMHVEHVSPPDSGRRPSEIRLRRRVRRPVLALALQSDDDLDIPVHLDMPEERDARGEADAEEAEEEADEDLTIELSRPRSVYPPA